MLGRPAGRSGWSSSQLADVLERHRHRALREFGDDRRAVGVEEPTADLADRTERHQFVEHPGVEEAALEQRGRRGRPTPTPNSMVSARRPASSVREITESLRIDATVDGSAYSGAGRRIASGAQHVRAATEDELHAGLIGGGRHGAVELDDDAAAGHAGASAVTAATCSGPQVKPRTSSVSRRISSAAARADAGAARPPARRVDAVSGDDGLGQAEPLLEFAFLVGVQVVLHGRRHDDLDAHQTLGLGPGDQPARGRPGDAELGRRSRPASVRRGSRASPRAGRDADPRASRRRSGRIGGRFGHLAVRRRCRHDLRSAFRRTGEQMLRGACRCSSR